MKSKRSIRTVSPGSEQRSPGIQHVPSYAVMCTAGEVRKAGETDVSHKDYLISWGPGYLERNETTGTPDLFTAFGVDRQSGKTVRLPTTAWPFDHTAVMTTFMKPGKASDTGKPLRKATKCSCRRVPVLHSPHTRHFRKSQSVCIHLVPENVEIFTMA